jgi:hypothetical protein
VAVVNVDKPAAVGNVTPVNEIRKWSPEPHPIVTVITRPLTVGVPGVHVFVPFVVAPAVVAESWPVVGAVHPAGIVTSTREVPANVVATLLPKSKVSVWPVAPATKDVELTVIVPSWLVAPSTNPATPTTSSRLANTEIAARKWRGPLNFDNIYPDSSHHFRANDGRRASKHADVLPE